MNILEVFKLKLGKLNEFMNQVVDRVGMIYDSLNNDEMIKETLFSSNSRTYMVMRDINIAFSLVNWIPLIMCLRNFSLSTFIGHLAFAIFIYVIWIFEKATKAMIFEEIRFFMIAQITAHNFFGVFLHFYDRYTYYDDFLHVTGGICMTVFAFPIILGSELAFSKRKIPSIVIKVDLSTFSFAATLGVIWEIIEFTADLLFRNVPGYHLAQQDNFDTMTDLIYDCGGAVIGIILFWKLLKRLNKNRNMDTLLGRIGDALNKFENRKYNRNIENRQS